MEMQITMAEVCSLLGKKELELVVLQRRLAEALEELQTLTDAQKPKE